MLLAVVAGTAVAGRALAARVAPPAGRPVLQRTEYDAPRLQPGPRFRGGSMRDTTLSAAVYYLTKVAGEPRLIDVACWSDKDWRNVSPDADGEYETLAFFNPRLPHWVELSPSICRALDTLLYHRPQFPNRFTANAIETLAHETMHAIGISSEPMAECLGMQSSIQLALHLHIPSAYADRLAHLNLQNYLSRPPSYIDFDRCREGGEWDLAPSAPSPPWHPPSAGR